MVVNCIVDASIFVLCGVFLLCASRPGPAALFVVWWVLGRGFCLCCVLFLWAFGGCLGTRGRCRTWWTAISLGEPSCGP